MLNICVIYILHFYIQTEYAFDQHSAHAEVCRICYVYIFFIFLVMCTFDFRIYTFSTFLCFYLPFALTVIFIYYYFIGEHHFPRDPEHGRDVAHISFSTDSSFTPFSNQRTTFVGYEQGRYRSSTGRRNYLGPTGGTSHGTCSGRGSKANV